MSSSYRIELDKWLAQLEVKALQVLDIGGAQLEMPNRVKSWNVHSYIIADLPSPHEGNKKPDIEMDINCLLPNESPAHDESYVVPDKWRSDLIFCLEVFEYVWNPFQAFINIERLLCKGGTAWISFPSFYPLHQPVEDDALRYMPGGIKKLADAVGLEVVQMIKRRPETNALDTFFKAERLRAARHEDHQFTGFIVEFRKS